MAAGAAEGAAIASEEAAAEGAAEGAAAAGATAAALEASELVLVFVDDFEARKKVDENYLINSKICPKV